MIFKKYLSLILELITVSWNTSLVSGAVSGSHPNPTVFLKSSSAHHLALACLGRVKWISTIAEFPGILKDNSTSFYSVIYNGNYATLIIYDYFKYDGSLICYSEEANNIMMDESAFSVYISDG